MTVETASFINTLDATYPAATDAKSEGDDHLRLIKTAVKATFPNVTGAVTPTHTQLNFVTGVTSAIQTQINTKAPTASPTLTGTAILANQETSGTATFAGVTINGTLDMNAGTAATITGLATPTGTTDAATKGYVDTAISNLVASSPAALDTLAELATALGNDAAFSTTVTNSIATKLPLAGGTLSGVLNMGSNKITALATPSAGTDAVNLSYVSTLFGSTAAAASSASDASTSASSSASSASAASTSATNAATSATNSATSATTAANYLTIGTSSTSVLIGTGAKSFTVTTLKAWGAGQFLSLASNANSANYMHGTVTSYNSGTGALVMNILNTGGSGTAADWNIAVAGTQGPTGAAGAGLTPQTVGFTATGGTTAKTLTVDVDLTASTVATLAGNQTFTGTKTFNGSSSIFGAVLLDSAETVNVVAAAPSATTNFYVQSGSVQYYTSNAANNWTLNVAFSAGTSLNAALAIGQSVTFVLVTTQGATAFYNSALTIDGTSVTPKYIGGAPTAGNASGFDVYRYAVVKTASATYTVLASLTQYK